MNKIYRKIISFVLVIALLACSLIPISASEIEEEYLSDLRLIYANDVTEARQILKDSEFEGYKVLNKNLNQNSGETGVWLAYKITTDIEDAITDIAIMEMDGGFSEGNYQEMIKKSKDYYLEMGEVYLDAIKYWKEAYEAEYYIAESVYRQLNFYNIVSEDVPAEDIPVFEGERLGDIFLGKLNKTDIATIFMQGNTHVLKNIRSLLAMGVSYNEDGKHYLEKVGEAVELYEEDDEIFEEYDNFDDFDGLAVLISGSILTFRDMFEELSNYEDELDYEDEELTDLEKKYAEYKSFADRMRDVKYFDDMSLYDFCLEYEFDEDDLEPLYPLVAALNEGQIAMTKVAHYYDVVRYSMSEYPEEALDELISIQEEVYSIEPFNVYNGVDRSIFYGTFALTSEAERADAYTSDGFLAYMFQEQTVYGVTGTVSAVASTALGIWAIRRTLAAKSANQTAQQMADKLALNKAQAIADAKAMYTNAAATAGKSVAATQSSALGTAAEVYGSTYNDVVNALLMKYTVGGSGMTGSAFELKISMLVNKVKSMGVEDAAMWNKMNTEYFAARRAEEIAANTKLESAQNMTETVTSTASTSGLTVALYIVSGILMLYTAFSIIMTVHNYYHPDYDDVPIALVDLAKTADGDRYVKYDVVYNAETNTNGVYEPGDLNAYKGLRWNAMYTTKSYEAGKPILADSFSASTTNSAAKTGYTPVHKFGETVCFNLNKYNYSGSTKIYLSVKQSSKDKSAVADVPELIGSTFGEGLILLCGGIGALLGVGGTIGVQMIIKKKRKSDMPDAEEATAEA